MIHNTAPDPFGGNLQMLRESRDACGAQESHFDPPEKRMILLTKAQKLLKSCYISFCFSPATTASCLRQSPLSKAHSGVYGVLLLNPHS
jgi:hypothetical protein